MHADYLHIPWNTLTICTGEYHETLLTKKNQTFFRRLARMDSESIWNWSAYVALIKASALISDWQFKHCWCTGNTSVFFPSPLLIINKLGGVVCPPPSSLQQPFLLTSLQIWKRERCLECRIFPPFSSNNSWRLKETSHRNLSIPCVNNAVWNLMAWVILGFLYTHIFFQ